MSSQQVEFSHQGSLAVITLNRPEARNALTPRMVDDLSQSLQDCRGAGIRAVLLTGVGGAFCAGADVKDFADTLEDKGPSGLSQHLHQMADKLHREVILALRRLDKPVLAAINGVAAGAGFSLALACDLRVASSDARFFMAYAGIGCTADGGSTYSLPRLVGAGRAMEIYLASQPIGAEYARELGLVKRWIDTGAKAGKSQPIVVNSTWNRLPLSVANRSYAAAITSDGKYVANAWGNRRRRVPH